jgi:hypothetical protein
MAKGKMFLNKRIHPRMLVKLPITFDVLDEKAMGDKSSEWGKAHLSAEGLNASLDGMYIVSDETLKPGDHVSLEINLPKNGNSLKVLTNVVWSDKSGAGLNFVAMTEEDIKTLENYLNNLHPGFVP